MWKSFNVFDFILLRVSVMKTLLCRCFPSLLLERSAVPHPPSTVWCLEWHGLGRMVWRWHQTHPKLHLTCTPHIYGIRDAHGNMVNWNTQMCFTQRPPNTHLYIYTLRFDGTSTSMYSPSLSDVWQGGSGGGVVGGMLPQAVWVWIIGATLAWGTGFVERSNMGGTSV